jgi:hypothetical protein
MARFIEVTQVNPGVGKMTVNVDYIIKFEKSGHADGGTSILVKEGMATYDSESGYQSFDVLFRVSESYATVKRLVFDAIAGAK